MATPTLVTVNGDLSPALAAERVEFWIPTLVRSANGPDVLLPGLHSNLVVEPEIDGTFSLQVYGTNDPNWSPTNWTYRVRILGDNLHQELNVQVPYDAGTVNFGPLLPTLPASLGTLYAAYNHGSHVIVLQTGEDVPPGTPPNTVIVRI